VVVENRHNPTRAQATLAELTLIVRPAGNPQGVRAFTDAERAEAELYAGEHQADVEPLG
jgi:hypothetical protein